MVFCAKSFLLFALIVTILIPNSLQIDVRCEYQISHGWKLIENPDNDPYGCFIKNTLNVNGKTSITSATGQHNNGYDDSSVVALNIYEGTCEVIPSGFSSVFPNVEYFSVWSAKLKSVSSADIQQFSKLREIWLYSNNLEYLESNLFEFNPNVQYINFNSNKIKYIGGNFFTNLPNLQKANFRDNPCTSSEANDGAALEAIKREIRQQCPINGAGERIGDGAKTIGWDDFVLVFNKTYADNSAKAYRQQIFLQNQQIIRTHNSLYDQGGSTYSLAFNIFGDWTFTEYLSIMGFFPSQQSKDDFAAAALYDLSNVGLQNVPGGGFQNVVGGGFQNVPAGGFQNVPAGGFQNVPAGGFQNVVGGGFQNVPAGGFQNVPAGGFQNVPAGGFQNVPAGGFQNVGRIGFQNVPAGGLQNVPAGGFQNVPVGGFQNVPAGGFQNVPAGGFQNVPAGGFQNVPAGGFQNVPAGGFQNANGNGQQNVPANGFQNAAGGLGNFIGGLIRNVAGGLQSSANGGLIPGLGLNLRGKRSTTPETKDWRIDGAVTPIKNQQSCQSCWAFSAVGALEGLFFRKNGRLTSFSEQQLVDCSKKNHGCNKGYTNSAFLYTRCQGIVTDDTYPYIAKEKQCAVTEGLFKNVAYKSVLPNGDEDMLKDIVGNVGPVSAGMDFTNQNSMLFHDGVYLDDGCLSDLGSINHAILVIGYGHDSAKNMDYWLIKNSFGTTWGEGGYGKVARNKGNHCAIASAANYPVA